jgi:hypothetical protein
MQYAGPFVAIGLGKTTDFLIITIDQNKLFRRIRNNVVILHCAYLPFDSNYNCRSATFSLFIAVAITGKRWHFDEDTFSNS